MGEGVAKNVRIPSYGGGMGVGRVNRAPASPQNFKYGTNIVDRGLKVLFFGLFCYFSVFPLAPPGRG